MAGNAGQLRRFVVVVEVVMVVRWKQQCMLCEDRDDAAVDVITTAAAISVSVCLSRAMPPVMAVTMAVAVLVIVAVVVPVAPPPLLPSFVLLGAEEYVVVAVVGTPAPTATAAL